MKITRYITVFTLLILLTGSSFKEIEKTEMKGFIKISPAKFEWNKRTISLNEFEISDHTVTNLEYKEFIDATGYPAPLHWKNSIIPEGKEQFPVIFINRDDAEAYTKWLTKSTGRIHRLPTTCEYVWAAWGGVKNAKYSFGNNEKLLKPETVNFNSDGKRKFTEWEKFLKPSVSGPKNGYGLYNMTGNVWQIVETKNDPETATYTFRIETPYATERTIMGGGWFSSKEYLACGSTFSQSPEIRYPDLGIRLVREPEGSKWTVLPRQLCGTTNSSGRTFLSWAALNSDNKNSSFNIYRIEGTSRNQSGIRINAKPVKFTSFTDTAVLTPGNRYQYRVVEVNASGKEENPSEWTGVVVAKELNPVVMKFKPLFNNGGMAPIFGDLEGWGKRGCVIRLDNGNKETSQDPGIPVQLEAFSSTGKSLWRKNIAYHNNIFGSSSNAPFNVWDMNNDSKDEVITLLQIEDINYLAILDGMSGKLMYKDPWTPMASDLSRSSTRIQMSIAYLDGKNPAVITQTGIYENEIITAYDNRLNKLWDYKSFMETNGSGGHKIEIADVDGNGTDEVIYGTTCLNSDGTFRWSIYRQHPDKISVHDYIPGRPGLEVFYIVESSVNAGVYMVDASTGEVIWKNNREEDPTWSHGHNGWTADIWAGTPGMEAASNRAGHDTEDLILFTSDGKKITEALPSGYTPMEWDGDNTRELLSKNGTVIGNFDGKAVVPVQGVVPNPVPNTNLIFTADLAGDFRSELVVSGKDTDGRMMVMVITATDPIDNSFVCPSEERDYRIWLSRNIGGGYGSVYEYVLKPAGK